MKNQSDEYRQDTPQTILRDYISAASLAAMAERHHEWRNAVRLWEQARSVARHPDNQNWSEIRALFCTRQWCWQRGQRDSGYEVV